MSGSNPFSYAVLRVVPRVDRGERFNAGVVVFCRPLDYLAARTQLDERRLAALAPDAEPEVIRAHLTAFERIAAGDIAAGPIAELDSTARFHWLVSPSSTVIQPSRVHTGLCEEPDRRLEQLFQAVVA